MRLRCHDVLMDDDRGGIPPIGPRRTRLRKAAEAAASRCGPSWSPSRWWPLTYLAGKLVYRLRDVILLMVVAGFVALILNPLVVAVRRWGSGGAGWPWPS